MSSEKDISRSILPIPDRQHVGVTTYDAKSPDTKYPPIEQLRPPKGAPNVLIILIDDAGFGSSSAFGGPCQTPNAEKLAAAGLKYNRFHTTALCSPTRAAMLSGRNLHAVGMGGITEIATSAPGYNSMRPNTCAPLAEILKLNGYSTAQFGKCHEVPVFETTPIGPFHHWPTGSGFEHFSRAALSRSAADGGQVEELQDSHRRTRPCGWRLRGLVISARVQSGCRSQGAFQHHLAEQLDR